MPLPQYPSANIEELECLWQRRVEVARERYILAAEHFNQVEFEQDAGFLPPLDGSLTVRDAESEESVACSEYLRVLQIFTDLTLYGKLPACGPDSAS